MADEPDVLLAAFLGNGEIRFARKARLRFDEVNVLADEQVDGIAGFRAVFHDDRRLVSGRVAIEIRARKKDARAEAAARFDFATQLRQVFHFSAHVSDRGDSIGNEKRKDELAAAARFARASKVNMHIGKARDEEFAGAIEDLRTRWNRDGFRGSHRGDVLVGDQHHHIRQRSAASRVDHRDVRDGERVVLPVGTRSRKQSQKK